MPPTPSVCELQTRQRVAFFVLESFPAQRPESLTAAYWRPNKKQSLCHTYLLQKPPLRAHWLVPKQPNSSRNRAQHAFPAQRPESLTAAYWRPNKKQSLCHTYPLPLAETSFKSPLAGSETAEQQQESCPTCLPSTAPRISNVAYWRPKKNKASATPTHYPWQKPALRVHWLVPKQPNSSRNRAQHAFPAHRPESLTLRTGALKKQSFCHTYPLQKPALRVHWLVPKQPNSSRNRAQHAFPAQRPESLTAAYWRPNKKQNVCHAYPLPMAETSFKSPLAGSETPEQQQESCPTCLPSTAPRISNVAYWRPNKKQSFCHTYPLRIAETSFESPLAGSETAEQQQESCPTCLPSTAPRISTVAYWHPKKNKTSATPTHCRNQLWESIGWFRNSRTAAGFVPNMPSQHSAPNL